MKKTILICCLLFFSFNTFGFDCKTMDLNESRRINYETSDIIFLGVPTSIDNGFAKFTIIEQFKGNPAEKYTVDLSIYPEEKQFLFSLWLVYAEKSENDTIFLTPCSITRCIEGLFLPHMNAPPRPVPEDTPNTIQYGEILDKMYLEKWRDDFYDEIEILRALKTIEKPKHEKNTQSYLYICPVLTVILFLLLLILFLLLRKR